MECRGWGRRDCASLPAGCAQKPGQCRTRSPEGSSASNPPPPQHQPPAPPPHSAPPPHTHPIIVVFPPLPSLCPPFPKRLTQRHKQGSAESYSYSSTRSRRGFSLLPPNKTQLTSHIQTTRSSLRAKCMPCVFPIDLC